MQTLTISIRWIFSIFLILVIAILALIYPVFSGTVTFLTHRENIFALIKDSGLYENTLSLAFENASLNIQKGSELDTIQTTVADENSAEGKLLREVITPTTIENAAHTALDGTYDWLEGKTSMPDFEIKIFKDEAQFDKAMSILLLQKVNSLPACEKQPTVTNPFELRCKPANYTQADTTKFFADLHFRPSYQELYKKSTFKSSTVFSLTQEESKRIQFFYSLFAWSPLLLTLIFGLFIALLLISLPYEGKFVLAGGLLLFLGASVMFITFFGRTFIHTLIAERFFAENISPATLDLIKSLIANATDKMTLFTILYSLCICVFGLFVIGFPIIRRDIFHLGSRAGKK